MISTRFDDLFLPKTAKLCFSKPRFCKGVPASIALRSTDSLWLENCMITQSFEPSRGRAAKVLVQMLRAAEAEKQGLKNRVWPPFGSFRRPGSGGRQRLKAYRTLEGGELAPKVAPGKLGLLTPKLRFSIESL